MKYEILNNIIHPLTKDELFNVKITIDNETTIYTLMDKDEIGGLPMTKGEKVQCMKCNHIQTYNAPKYGGSYKCEKCSSRLYKLVMEK